ncbi:MAG: T9SS type A sorting domain-containing protein [Candidatus Fermentibacteraceae bacterium]|nr:T9SS type A sorting domain-containing protein [Candidatus Fermentibacteraceae bacterium]
MGGGGVMAKDDCNVTLNNTIVNNLARLTGGGICTHGIGGAATFSGVNNIIVFNVSNDCIQCGSTGGGGPCNLTYSCILQDMPGIGNINDTPLFVNAFEDDYHLTSASPCIDSGDPSSPPAPDGTRADMGAYYFDQVGIGGVSTSDQEFVLNHVSPCPFNSSTDVSFYLPEAGNTTVTVFDTAGRLVIELTDRTMAAGEHTVTWNGRDSEGRITCNGVYFCRCEFCGESKTQRVVLLR